MQNQHLTHNLNIVKATLICFYFAILRFEFTLWRCDISTKGWGHFRGKSNSTKAWSPLLLAAHRNKINTQSGDNNILLNKPHCNMITLSETGSNPSCATIYNFVHNLYALPRFPNFKSLFLKINISLINLL